ncbi:Rieske 2Fe-2S domain-containing protein [Aestuariicella hydrocarbonica]|uniref:Rieske 2Fe-2S domain-containing protein n=1 Tax=Pseudomaricurvus hydrocarbonicus TaxID=1470433 RepID=A0A9E5JVF3_9GAMM|nr:SRPBCC family protein [Aestuariicella hydrocarbonica]NHO65989.1 Rieske 2Fe-2S domain-containing protein [Aestuariicella hydrocarbonica]
MSAITQNLIPATSAKENTLISFNDWPSNWKTGTQSVGTGRYTETEFAQLEFEKLWKKVWQAAARLDEIPETGDYTTYKIGDQSILLVRIDENNVKAYYNFCPHRGTTLGEGCGHFKDHKIICPYHGWRWDLAGNIQMILERNEFAGGNLRDEDVAMRSVHCVVYAGFVFINLDENPQPFEEFIAPVKPFLEDFVLADMHHDWWKRAPVPCNWKVAQEAFFEAYHVSATHPQLEKVGREVVYGDRQDGEMFYRDLTYIPQQNGHGHFFGGAKTPIAGHVQEPTSQDNMIDAMAQRMNLTAEGLQAMILKADIELLLSLKEKNLPADANPGAEYVKLQYETAAQQNRPMPKMTAENVGKWGGVNFIFPNILILPQAGNAAMYRVLPHPTDPNQCIFEIRSLKTLPAAQTPQRAEVLEVTDPEQQLGLIPRQDLSNLPRVQEGLRSQGMKQAWLAEKQESLILNMHRELDRYLLADTNG